MRTKRIYGGPWDLEGKRAFVPKWDMSRIRAFWYHFDSEMTQTNAIWLRLYSDIWSKKWWLEPLVLSSCEAVLSPWSSVLGPRSAILSPQSSVLSLQSSVLSPQSSVPRSSGCNKLYMCGCQKISKQSTFVAERLKRAVLLQKGQNFEKPC